jgi:acetolactate synthase-1/2/3 large subunit
MRKRGGGSERGRVRIDAGVAGRAVGEFQRGRGMTDLGSNVQAGARLASMVEPPRTVAEGIAEALRELGAVHACGVSGGAQALLWAALSKRLDVLHFRHESGAAFAATEAYFASGRPVVVFATTGPGITNALTGVLAAPDRRAPRSCCVGLRSAPHRGRGGIQETSGYTMPTAGCSRPGRGSTTRWCWKRPTSCRRSCGRLAAGLRRPGGYVAHLSVPQRVQGAP